MRSMLLVSSLIVCFLGAQISSAAITGQVKNTNRVPVQGATVTFTNESDPEDIYSAVTDDNGIYSIDYVPTGVEETLPDAFSLGQNYPNPFNPSTTIQFSLEERGFVSLSIYNVMGQKIRTLVSSDLSAGSHMARWNGCDDENRHVSAGIYFCQLKSGGMSESRKMLLLDGGSHSSEGLAGSSLHEVQSRSMAKTAGVSYSVTISADGIADFEENGLALTENLERNFTVFPNNGMIMSAIVMGLGSELSYIGTVSGLDIGSKTNSESIENMARYPGIFLYGDMVLISDDLWGDMINKYVRGEDGMLTKTGSMAKKPGAGSTDIAFVDETKAYLTLQDLGLLQVFNPTTMSVTKEIDLSEYAVGENDFNPDPVDMVIREDKLYISLYQSKTMYVQEIGVYVLIVDVATDTVEKMIVDMRSSTAGWFSSGQELFVDDYGDLYVGAQAMYGTTQEVSPGLVRIKKGETEFDPDYFFDLSEVYLPDVPGNMGIYVYPSYLYTGGSTMYSFCMVPGLMSDPPDYANDRPTVAFKFDLAAKTAEKIGFKPTNSYGIGLCGYDNKIVFGLTTVDGDGLYTYDPKTGEASATPVVKTVGFPMVLKAF